MSLDLFSTNKIKDLGLVVSFENRIDCSRMEYNNALGKTKGREARTTRAASPAATTGLNGAECVTVLPQQRQKNYVNEFTL